MALLSACLAGWNSRSTSSAQTHNQTDTYPVALSQAWVVAGQAVRGAQDLGLHRSPAKARMSDRDKERRRRVWWCVYGLDRSLSVSLGRPSGINDDDG
jgi:hypothetical protein